MAISFLKKHLFPVFLLLIIFFISLTNYQPRTFLTGWDTLHPEFDFGLNFKRLIFGVWRDEQGLGAVAGHSHMADLPRVVILWLLHFVFPLNSLRYLYIFTCLFLGPLGIYYLIRHLLIKTNPFSDFPSVTKKTFLQDGVAFLSSLFYLFNLATVQQFLVPFEMFPTQYAFLPWIILSTLKLLKDPTRKNILLFAFFTLISAPQAYAAQLYYAFFGVYSLFLVLNLLLHKNQQSLRKNILLLISLIVAINLFWILPNLYFIRTNVSVPQESKQNRLFSQEYQLRNRENGYLKDVALIKGFYFNWKIYDFTKEKFEPLTEAWNHHLDQKLILVIGYFYFVLVVLGFLTSFILREKLYIVFTPFLLIPFVFLMNHTPPFEQLFNFISQFSIFNEALRFVFSKFSILILFGFTVYLSFGLSFLVRFIARKNLERIFFLFFVCLSIIYCFPILKGQLISQKIKIKIPQEYFQLWDFMRNQKDGIILPLPAYNFSGWQYYQWGYQGAGFIWFGLKQPILDRDFDRWDAANEKAFREFFYSLYAKNPEFFNRTLEKYNISYILWDENIVTPFIKNRDQVLFKNETRQIINQLEQENKIYKVKEFGHLALYKVSGQKQSLTTKEINKNLTPEYKWEFFDYGYFSHKDYITITDDFSQLTNIFYPFRSLLDTRERLKSNNIQISRIDNLWQYSFILPQPTSAIIPNFFLAENKIAANLYLEERSGQYFVNFHFWLPSAIEKNLNTRFLLFGTKNTPWISFNINHYQFNIEKEKLQVDNPLYLGLIMLEAKKDNFLNQTRLNFDFEKIKTFFPSNIQGKGINFSADKITKLNPNASGITLVSQNEQDFLLYNSKNLQVGTYIEMSDLPHDIGYLVGFKSKFITGLPLRICIKNFYNNICVVYEELGRNETSQWDFFLIPPMDTNIGYGISVDNISFGNYLSLNQLEQIAILPFPFSYLNQIYYLDNDSLPQEKPAEAKKYQIITDSPFYKKLILNQPTNSTILVLNESFNPDWNAYTGDKMKIRQLVQIKVNNWANGWEIKNCQSSTGNCQIYVIFWPQVLEFIGFGLGIGVVTLFLRQKRLRNQN